MSCRTGLLGRRPFTKTNGSRLTTSLSSSCRRPLRPRPAAIAPPHYRTCACLVPVSHFLLRAIICSDGPGLTPIFTTAGEEISGMLGCAQANLTEKGELALKEAGERDGFALPGLDSKANR